MQRFLLAKLEDQGLNLSRDAASTWLTHKVRGRGLTYRETTHNSLDEPGVKSKPHFSIEYQQSGEKFRILWGSK